MIGYLQGKILDTDGKKALILTESGVGYEVNYGYFLDIGLNRALFIHHHITDSDASLWGFNNLVDKKMFELLKTVNKVGSSKAYPLITNIGTKGVIEAIIFDQPAVLSQAPGIGKKMAEQIILSLKDKITKFQAANIKAEEQVGIGDIEHIEASDDIRNMSSPVASEVLMALSSLGYKDQDVAPLVRKNIEAGESSSAVIIKNILRDL